MRRGGAGGENRDKGVKTRWRIIRFIKVACLWAIAALLAIWFASIWFDAEWWSTSGVRGGISHGRFEIIFDAPWPGYQSGWHVAHEWIARDRRPLAWKMDFYWSSHYGYLAIPIWQTVLWLGVATAIAWRLDVIGVRRARRGMCRGCGYDLSGMARGGKCPECGAFVTGGATAGTPMSSADARTPGR